MNWNLNREISKLNYRINTDVIRENLIPSELTPVQIAYTYANEADMLNVVLINPGKNQRERMELLRQLAVQPLQILETVGSNTLQKLDVDTKKN